MVEGQSVNVWLALWSLLCVSKAPSGPSCCKQFQTDHRWWVNSSPSTLPLPTAPGAAITFFAKLTFHDFPFLPLSVPPCLFPFLLLFSFLSFSFVCCIFGFLLCVGILIQSFLLNVYGNMYWGNQFGWWIFPSLFLNSGALSKSSELWVIVFSRRQRPMSYWDTSPTTHTHAHTHTHSHPEPPFLEMLKGTYVGNLDAQWRGWWIPPKSR